MPNELVFLSIILGLMVPAYIMLSSLYIENRKAYRFFNMGAMFCFMLIGKLYFNGSLDVSIDSTVFFSILAIVNTPTLLFGYYVNRRMLLKAYDNRKKYFVLPIVVSTVVVFVVNVLKHIIT